MRATRERRSPAYLARWFDLLSTNADPQTHQPMDMWDAAKTGFNGATAVKPVEPPAR
jgi:hypothetical protein